MRNDKIMRIIEFSYKESNGSNWELKPPIKFKNVRFFNYFNGSE